MQFIFNDCFKKILQQHSHEDLKKWKENVDKNKENDSGFKAVMKYGIRIEKHELKLTKSRHTKFLDSTDLNMVSSYTDFTQKIQHSRFFFLLGCKKNGTSFGKHWKRDYQNYVN